MLPRLACLLLLCLLPAARGGTIPVALHDGRLTTNSPGAEIMLGAPWWFWEGGSSRVEVIDRDGELTILFHLDVANTAYWIDLQIVQTDAGVALIGSHSSGIWPDVCESYRNWADLLRHRDQPLAEIAVCCLRRCGMDERWVKSN